MQENELLELWKAQDIKINNLLTLNKNLVSEMTKVKLDKTIGTLSAPKITSLLLGVPYTLLLLFITFIGIKAEAPFVVIGFGSIAIIMLIVIVLYIYHLYLIYQIRSNEDVFNVQKRLSELTISSYNCMRIAIVQLPFWSICWMSLNALKASPWIYGGVNLLVFALLSYFAFRLYRSLAIENSESKLHKFLMSGSFWEPIEKSKRLLEQLKV